MGTRITKAEASLDPQLMGPWFSDRSFDKWRVVSKAADALPLTDPELKVFREIAGGREPPNRPVRELYCIFGRRTAKTLYGGAAEAVCAAVFQDYSPYLKPGETPTVAIFATDRAQARVSFTYIRAFFREIPLLRGMVVRESTEEMELNNGVAIMVMTNDYRRLRGRTIVLVIFEETAFWRDEQSTLPDIETYNAAVPAMATIPTARLIVLTTPYRKSGLVWDKFKQHYGQDDNGVLVLQAPSTAMNPTLDESFINEQLARDPAAAAAEWLAQFRDDISGFLEAVLIDDAIMSSRRELPPKANTTYHGFTDPSGGGPDAFTLGICHLEEETVVLDVCRAHRRVSPEKVVAEYAGVLKEYGVRKVTGDKYAGRWPADAFAKHGITYEHSTLTRSEIYQEVLALFTRGAVRLLDIRDLHAELRQLERRTSRSGKDTIDHGPGGHDDLANSCCGALWLASAQRDLGSMIDFVDIGDDRPQHIQLSEGATPWTL